MEYTLVSISNPKRMEVTPPVGAAAIISSILDSAAGFTLLTGWDETWNIDFLGFGATYIINLMVYILKQKYIYLQIISKSKHTNSLLLSFQIFRFLSDICINGLVQGCSNTIANALELLQFCTKPSI